MSGERKPRVPALEAKAKLIEATISLLREIRVTELSTRKIEERSDLDRRAITRQFGGELGLFIATLEELNLRAAKRSRYLTETNHGVRNEELKMRTDLLAFLILSGVDKERLRQMEPASEVVETIKQGIGMHPETPPDYEEAFLALLQAIIFGRTLFGPVSPRDTPENQFLIFKILRYLMSLGPELPALIEMDDINLVEAPKQPE